MGKENISIPDVFFYRRSLLKRAKDIFLRDCFSYPVIYTDGLISRRKDDLSERTPWGFMFCGYGIALHDSPYAMSPGEGEGYCWAITVGGYQCTVGSWELMSALCGEFSSLNHFLEEIHGSQLRCEWYLAKGYFNAGNDFFIVHPNIRKRTLFKPEDDSKLWVRPVFDFK